MKVRNKNVRAELALRLLSGVGSGLVILEQGLRDMVEWQTCIVTMAISTGKRVAGQI